MKATFKNFGAIKHATLEVGDLTILTGHNNTGKTYATYALYGFLRSWKELDARPTALLEYARQLEAQLKVSVPLTNREDGVKDYLRIASGIFSRRLSRFFAADKKDKVFDGAAFEFALSEFKTDPSKGYQHADSLYEASRPAGSETLEVKLVDEAMRWFSSIESILASLSGLVADAIIGVHMPRPVILTSERTGTILFWRELDTQKNVLVDALKNSSGSKINVHQMVQEMAARYARPIQDNIDTTRNYPVIAKNESWLMEKHPEVMEAFTRLAGGNYKVGAGKEPHFTPSAKLKKKGGLPLYLGSSSVRSLMSLSSYLQHQATKGDILMIDEPELNLHPAGQRQLARLMALLVRAGIKVFVTTHSDYLVREVNNLIKLHADFPGKAKLLKKQRYDERELLKPSQVKLYVAENATLCPVAVGAEGFSRTTFDEVLKEMNAVEDALMIAKEGWGDA